MRCWFENKAVLLIDLDWTKAPVEALVEVFTPDVRMFPQKSYPFGCRASKFVSDGTLQWVIRGKDGSEILLHKSMPPLDVKCDYLYESRSNVGFACLIDRVQDIMGEYPLLETEVHTVRQSNIRLIYPNDYDIICKAPYWNYTGWIQNHKRINVECNYTS